MRAQIPHESFCKGSPGSPCRLSKNVCNERDRDPSSYAMMTSSQCRQHTLSRKSRDSSVMIHVEVSPEMQMLKPGQGVNAADIDKIVIPFLMKCIDCFFMGRNFKFDMSIT